MTGNKVETCCSAWRYFAAIFYDFILLFAVLFFATAMILPFYGGKAVGSGDIIYFLYLLSISYLYFTWQWVHGGQTLGMRAWGIKLTAGTGKTLTWRLAGGRFLCSLLSWLLLGIGFFWRLFDREGRTLHDRLSGTYLMSVRDEQTKS